MSLLNQAARMFAAEKPFEIVIPEDAPREPVVSVRRMWEMQAAEPAEEPAQTLGENPKDRIGITKPSLHLIPASAQVREAKVFELGAAKYGAFNWRRNSVLSSVYVSAALRHIHSYFDGESVDPESGQPHLAHARACMGILLDAMDTGNLVDDRPTPGVTAMLIRDLQVKP